MMTFSEPIRQILKLYHTQNVIDRIEVEPRAEKKN